MDKGFFEMNYKLWEESWLPTRVKIEASTSPEVRIRVENKILFPVIEAIYRRICEEIMRDIDEKI